MISVPPSTSPGAALSSTTRSVRRRGRTSPALRSSPRRAGCSCPAVSCRSSYPGCATPTSPPTYAQIARRGIGALYGGAVGRDVVQTVHNLPLASGATLTPRPGAMTLADLAAYSAPFVAPTHVRYRGRRCVQHGRRRRVEARRSGSHSTSSPISICGPRPRFRRSITCLESTRLAFADRNRYIGDPRFVERAGSAVALTRVRPPAGVSDQPGAPRSPVPSRPVIRSPAPGGCSVTRAPGRAPPLLRDGHEPLCGRRSLRATSRPYTNTIEQLGGERDARPRPWSSCSTTSSPYLPIPLPAKFQRLLHRQPSRRRQAAAFEHVADDRPARRAARSSPPERPEARRSSRRCSGILVNRIDLGMSLPAGDRRPASVAAQQQARPRPSRRSSPSPPLRGSRPSASPSPSRPRRRSTQRSRFHRRSARRLDLSS